MKEHLYIRNNENTMTILRELLEIGYNIKLHAYDVGNQDHLALTLVHQKYDDAQLIVLKDDEHVVKDGDTRGLTGILGDE